MTVTFDRDFDDQPACFICGCSTYQACPGGCAWADDPEADGLDVCTACVALRDALGVEGRPVSLAQLSEWSGEQRDEAWSWLVELDVAEKLGGARPLEPAFVGGLGG